MPDTWNTSVIFVLNFILLFQARNGTQSLALPISNEILRLVFFVAVKVHPRRFSEYKGVVFSVSVCD